MVENTKDVVIDREPTPSLISELEKSFLHMEDLESNLEKLLTRLEPLLPTLDDNISVNTKPSDRATSSELVERVRSLNIRLLALKHDLNVLPNLIQL